MGSLCPLWQAEPLFDACGDGHQDCCNRQLTEDIVGAAITNTMGCPLCSSFLTVDMHGCRNSQSAVVHIKRLTVHGKTCSGITLG